MSFLDSCAGLMPTWFTGYTVPCCDNCLRDENITEEFPLIIDLLSAVFGTGLTATADSDTFERPDEEDASSENENSYPITDTDVVQERDDTVDMGEESDDGAGPDDPTQPRRLGPRRAQRLADCRNFLTEWRQDCWEKNYHDHLWGPSIILPDHLITKFASSAWVKSVEDVRRELGDWMWIDEYSGEVLEGLGAVDRKYEEVRQAKERERQRQKAEQEAEREKKKEEARRQREEQKEQTKKRKAEERVRKREEKKREEQIAAEERVRKQMEIEEMEKRRRTGYDTYLDLPPQIQDFPPPPLPARPRPRLRKKPIRQVSPAQDQENTTAPWPGAFQPPAYHDITPPYLTLDYSAPAPMHSSPLAVHFAVAGPSEIPPTTNAPSASHIPYQHSYLQQSVRSFSTVGSYANFPHSRKLSALVTVRH